MLSISKFKKTYEIFKGFRLINEADSLLLLTWRNSDHVRIYMKNSDLITREIHQQWFQKIITSETDLYFVYEQNKTPWGIVYFNNIDRNTTAAEWGFYLGKQNLPKGTGTKMLNNAILLATNKIKLSRIYATVLSTNNKSLYMHLKLGFKQEGDKLVLDL